MKQNVYAWKLCINTSTLFSGYQSFIKEIKPTENYDATLTELSIYMSKNKDMRKLHSKLYSSFQSVKKHSANKIIS